MRSTDVETVWRAFHDQLLAFIRRRVPRTHDAEDVLQEVFVRVQANAERLARTDHPASWLHRIAINAIADHYRHESRTPVPGPAFADAVAEDGGTTPDAELARCLEPFAHALPEPYREAVLLVDFAGRPQREVATELGVGTSALKSRVQRGRRKLLGLLLECCHVELDRTRGIADYERRSPGCCGPECSGDG